VEEIALEAKNITKYFPGVLANDHINFKLCKGEIHTLLGENGAGKTTLMNVFDGIYSPNDGELYINGKKVYINSPFDAMKFGIGMIHQHFMLVDTLTVVENVVLGLQNQGFMIDKSIIVKKIREISQKYNFKVNPYAKIWQLSVGEQQRVEIIKTLFRGAEVLILDEPTAVLTPQESDSLFTILNQIKSDGKSIIFISHKLEEVLKISDRISVLRKGRLVGTVNKSDVSEKDLAMMMIGREVLFRLERKPIKRGGVVLTIDNLEGYNDRGIKTLRGVNFVVHSGEIFGIAGVAGNGQEELAEIITGLRKATAGRVLVNECSIGNLSTCSISEKGVNYIPSDRLKFGLIPGLSSIENAILRCYRRKPVSNGLIINYLNAKEYAKNLIKEYDIMVPREDAPVKLLSGGNMQKLILAREMYENPILLVAVHPTRGLDVGATEFIRRKLLEGRDSGTAVLLISEDLDEIRMISDRIGVMYEGKINGIVNAEEADINEIGLMMGGSTIKYSERN
jgi:ABC-type uncharacterized transport system ATPase subunit